MSYTQGAQTKSGVEEILKDTFMHNVSVNISGVSSKENVIAKKEEGYIIASPEKKNSEIAAALGVANYEVLDTKNNKVSNDKEGATGYIFKDKTNSSVGASYTMVVLGDIDGDGRISATDYMKIKNHIMGSIFTDLEKKAADVDEMDGVAATDYMKIKNHIMTPTKISVTKTNGTTISGNMSYADIIMKAAEESGISPYSIAIKIIQEVGSEGSGSVSGNYPGYEGYYNFFNWGSNDDPNGNAIANGLKRAKSKGWDNQYKAIVEGARILSDNYVSIGQNTAYFYKFNVIDNGKHPLYTHQYMSNIQDPATQSASLMDIYFNFDASLNFIIPVFRNMPSHCYYPSTLNSDTKHDIWEITGIYVSMRSTPAGGKIKTFADGEPVILLDYGDNNDKNGYYWAKVKDSKDREGYVARIYIRDRK